MIDRPMSHDAHKSCSSPDTEYTGEGSFDQFHLGLGIVTNATSTVSLRKRDKFRDKLRDIGASIDRMHPALRDTLKSKKSVTNLRTPSLEREREFELNAFFYHTSSDIYSEPGSISPSTSSTVTENDYRTSVTRKAAKPESPNIPPQQRRNDRVRIRNIGRRVTSATVDKVKFEREGDYFMACTPTQLQELNETIRERVQLVKAYIGPPTSPNPENVRSLDENFSWPKKKQIDHLHIDAVHGLTSLSIYDIRSYNDFTPLDQSKVHNTLARNRGTRYGGIQVLGTNLPYTYSLRDNRSSYYSIPILEPAWFTRSFYHPSSPVTEIFKDDDELEEEGEEDKEEEEPKKMFAKFGKSRKQVIEKKEQPQDPWLRKEEFLPARTQMPAHSLILYLIGRGDSTDDIVRFVSALDDAFLFESTSRWSNGYRIPEHWEFTQSIVYEISVHCGGAEKERSEEALAVEPVTMSTKERMKLKKVKVLVRSVVEGYLWWRLRGGEKFRQEGGVYGKTELLGLESPNMLEGYQRMCENASWDMSRVIDC